MNKNEMKKEIALQERLEQLQEKYPSDDPLVDLYTWTTETRTQVAKALKPYIRVMSHDGSLQWLVSPSLEGDQLAQDVELLARAVAWELVGVDKQYHLRNEQAQDLATEIIGAGQDAL